MKLGLPILALALGLSSYSVRAGDLEDSLNESLSQLSNENCPAQLKAISHLIDSYDADDYKSELKKRSTDQLLGELWKFKIGVHEKLRSFHRTHHLKKDCSVSARAALRAVRFAEDTLHDQIYRKRAEGEVFPDSAFAEGNLQVKRNPRFEKFNLKEDLRSGDIILSRGNAFTSAAIASLGEFDTQFSHISLVYKDEKGELWTVEAHIEVGSFVRPLQDHMDDKNFRTMIYRFEDERIAQEAAKYIFEKVKKASETTGNILYDFGFDQDNSDKLFCSEVVSHAYDKSSNGSVKIPLHRSRLMTRKPEFVKNLEITVEESFIPADIEVDPRFSVIAEWRDSAKIQNILEKDAILHSMFRWNDELDYQMVQASSRKSFIYRNVAWPLRRVPFLKKYFKDKLPINMSRKLIGYFGVLESIGELLQKELALAHEVSLKETGFLLSPEEQDEFLDQYRERDLKSKKKKLHKMYRPRKKGK